MKPEKHLVEKTTALPPACVSVSDFFDEEVITDSKDIMIPRILLMQGTSDFVGLEKARQGDIVDSISVEVLATSKKPVEFIPIKQLDKEWVIEKLVGKKYEYERTEPWDPAFEKQWEFEVDGVPHRRNAKLSFYVMLARDAGGHHLPYLVSFQRTGYKAGRNIASFFSEAMFAFRKGDTKSIPMAQVFELGCRVEQGDLGTYYVFDCKRTRVANEAEIEKGKYWFTQLRTKKYEVHASEPASEEGVREF